MGLTNYRLDPLLESKLGEPQVSSGGKEYRFNCPFCVQAGKSEDDDYHLYYNPSKFDEQGRWNCFRCESKGNSKTLYLRLGLPYGKGKSQSLLVDFFKYMDDALDSMDMNHPEIAKEEEKVELPPGCKVTVFHSAYDYLLSRGLTVADINYYNVMVGFGRYNDRVIVPDMSEDGPEARYWVARLLPTHLVMRPMIYDRRTGKWMDRPKYLNPQASRRDKVFDLERVIKNFNHIIICEGVFSSMLAGWSSGATYGKQFTDTQVRLIRDGGFKTYYPAYDGDAWDKTIELSERLRFYGAPDIRPVKLPYEHDPASIGRSVFHQLVCEAKPYDEFLHLIEVLEAV